MNTQINLICDCCKIPFQRPLNHHNLSIKRKYEKTLCSKKCRALSNNVSIEVKCLQCSKIFHKGRAQCNKHPNHFCCQSCAAKYNNTHKTHGTRRSKLEIYLEEQLKQKYPNLEIHFNRKDAINSELDIYIPSLKLAFELNGIFHYEPIYGPDKLISVQNNDQRKFQACLEKQIGLCIIDTSKFKNFKELKAKEFLDIIIQIINQSL